MASNTHPQPPGGWLKSNTGLGDIRWPVSGRRGAGRSSSSSRVLHPQPTPNLADTIHARFAALGGVDLPVTPREPMREPPAFD